MKGHPQFPEITIYKKQTNKKMTIKPLLNTSKWEQCHRRAQCWRLTLLMQQWKIRISEKPPRAYIHICCVTTGYVFFSKVWRHRVRLGLWELEPFKEILFKARSITANTSISWLKSLKWWHSMWRGTCFTMSVCRFLPATGSLHGQFQAASQFPQWKLS